MSGERTPARKKARELAKYLHGERPDYTYCNSEFFWCLARRDRMDFGRSCG